MERQYKCQNLIQLLSESEIHNIHTKSLQILEQVGLGFQDKDALKIMDDNGCRVDHKKMVVKFPGDLVEKLISQCTTDISLQGREGKNRILFDRETVQFGPCSGMQIMEINNILSLAAREKGLNTPLG